MGVFHAQCTDVTVQRDKVNPLRREVDMLIKDIAVDLNESYEPPRSLKIRWATIKLVEEGGKLQHKIIH